MKRNGADSRHEALAAYSSRDYFLMLAAVRLDASSLWPFRRLRFHYYYVSMA